MVNWVKAEKPCRVCGGECFLNPSQNAKSDFICRACRYEQDRKYRELRKSQGRSVSGTTFPKERRIESYKEYSQRECVKKRRRERYKADLLNPERAKKIKARLMARNAIYSGALIRQPCEKCGDTKVHAHHDDYDQPLNVRWLCPSHHAQHHARGERHE